MGLPSNISYKKQKQKKLGYAWVHVHRVMKMRNIQSICCHFLWFVTGNWARHVVGLGFFVSDSHHFLGGQTDFRIFCVSRGSVTATSLTVGAARLGARPLNPLFSTWQLLRPSPRAWSDDTEQVPTILRIASALSVAHPKHPFYRWQHHHPEG